MSDVSEIFKLVVDNFPKLHAIDFLILLVLSSAFFWMIFKVFQWFYKEINNKKDELLKIKDSHIETYKDKLELNDRENESLKKIIDEYKIHNSQIYSEYETLMSTNESNKVLMERLFRCALALSTQLVGLKSLVAQYRIFATNLNLAIILREWEKSIKDKSYKDDGFYDEIMKVTKILDDKDEEFARNIPRSPEEVQNFLSGKTEIHFVKIGSIKSVQGDLEKKLRQGRTEIERLEKKNLPLVESANN